VPVPTSLSFLGIAKESVKGTPVSPTFYLPVKTITPEDLPKYLPVEVMKGSMAQTYGFVQGLKYTTFEMGGPVFADALGWSLMGALGDVSTTASRSVSDGVTDSTVTVTSATASFTSADVGKSLSGGSIPAGAFIEVVNSGTSVTISAAATASASSVPLTIGPPEWHAGGLLNSGNAQPTSHTLTDFYAVTQARQYAGIQWHDVTLKFSAEGLLEQTSKATGLVPSAQVAKPSQSFTALLPIPTWKGIAQIGGSVMAKSMDGEVQIVRKMELVPGMNATQQYAQVFIGECQVKFKLSAFVDDDTELLRMLNDTEPSLDLNWSSLTGASSQQVALHMSQAAYTKAKINRGKSYVAIDVEGEAVSQTTDVGASGGFGPIKAYLGNNVASGTYV